jgi:hypothetical protein
VVRSRYRCGTAGAVRPVPGTKSQVSPRGDASEMPPPCSRWVRRRCFGMQNANSWNASFVPCRSGSGAWRTTESMVVFVANAANLGPCRGGRRQAGSCTAWFRWSDGDVGPPQRIAGVSTDLGRVLPRVSAGKCTRRGLWRLSPLDSVCPGGSGGLVEAAGLSPFSCEVVEQAVRDARRVVARPVIGRRPGSQREGHHQGSRHESCRCNVESSS